MDLLSGIMEGGQIWTLVAAIGAMISIIYAGMPLLDRADTKERVKAVVTERRRSLAASQRDEMEAKKALIKPEHTASQSLAALFQVERYAGLNTVREKLASAGHRSPKAALIYMIARLVSPVAMALIGFLYTTGFDLSASERGLIALGAGIFGFFLPALYIYNKASKRKQEIAQNFPDALDLMLVCV
ncbi:MAG: hypothetical protein AAF213_06455, partial [Pseudomonadota bacterium]